MAVRGAGRRAGAECGSGESGPVRLSDPGGVVRSGDQWVDDGARGEAVALGAGAGAGGAAGGDAGDCDALVLRGARRAGPGVPGLLAGDA